MFDHLRVRVYWGWLGRLLALLFVLGLVAGSAYAWDGVAFAQEPIAPDAALAPGVVIHYQAQLLDPATGQPKADGVYPVVFRLYNVNTGGSALWTESKNVTLSRGAFSTLLGDTTALNLGHFSGQDLWLGVTVGADAEAMPRQRIAYAPYALRAVNAGNADKVDGQHAAAFAASSHNHAGEQITSGTVADARVAATLTRDNEVMTIVKGSDGAGSGVDADTVDGLQASAFAASSHNHAGEQIASGTVADARVAATLTRDNEVMTIVKGSDGAGSGVDADTVDGQQASAFAPSIHNHLGQTWTGVNYPLRIDGSYSDPPAPLLLGNLAAGADGLRIVSSADDGIQIDSANFGLFVVNPAVSGVLVHNAGGLGVYAESQEGSKFNATGTANILVGQYNDADRFRVESTTGNLWVYGRVSAQGYDTHAADLAELLPAVGGLTPGDVLVIGPDGRLGQSTAPNATSIAGVYSIEPGLLGGIPEGETADGPSPESQAFESLLAAKAAGDLAGVESAEQLLRETSAARAVSAAEVAASPADLYASAGKAPLAVVGVVPTKVTAEGGPILPGDLLTTSSTPGHAMKAAPIDVGGVAIYRPGTILGKALEPLAAGAGVIKVLVMPQ